MTPTHPPASVQASERELLEALRELLEAETAPFPSERYGKTAQDEWAARSANARRRAAELIASHSLPTASKETQHG